MNLDAEVASSNGRQSLCGFNPQSLSWNFNQLNISPYRESWRWPWSEYLEIIRENRKKPFLGFILRSYSGWLSDWQSMDYTNERRQNIGSLARFYSIAFSIKHCSNLPVKFVSWFDLPCGTDRPQLLITCIGQRSTGWGRTTRDFCIGKGKASHQWICTLNAWPDLLDLYLGAWLY